MGKVDLNCYETFIKQNFPTSSILSNPGLGLVFTRVNENNFFVELLSKYIKECQESIFLNRFQCQLNKVLLYIPLNDASGINFCVRSAIESLLKFFYTLYFEFDYDRVNKTSFRNMKEDLLKSRTDKYINLKDLNKLFNMYSSFSNSIHNKKQTSEVQFEYLQNIISNQSYNLEVLHMSLLNITDIYLSLLVIFFNFGYKDLSVAEKLHIRRMLGTNRYKKIRKILELST